MKAIVAVDSTWGIGRNNELLFHIKEDLKRFKELTMFNVVVMGRKTFESLPNKKALPSRVNIVLTSDKNYKAEGCTVVNSIEELRKELKQYDTNRVYIIGGESLYKQFIDECTDVLVTFVYKNSNADKFFPRLIEDKEHWDYICGPVLYDEKEQCKFEYAIFNNKRFYNKLFK